MTRYLGLFVLLIYTCSFAFSQTEGEDLVQLKDGTTVRGIIIEQRPGEFIKVLQIPSHDTVKIDLSAIESLLKIVPISGEEEVTHLNQDEFEHKDSILLDTTETNYFNTHLYQVQLSFSKVFKDYAGEGFGLSLHRKIQPDLQVGLGFSYFNARINLPYQYRKSVAFFAEINHGILLSTKGRLAFVSGLELGYNVDFSDVYYDLDLFQQVSLSNGLYTHPHVGFRFNLSKNTGLLADIGYQYIHATVKNPTTNAALEGRNWSSFVVRISLFF